LGGWVADHRIEWVISRFGLSLLDCWYYSRRASKAQHLELQARDMAGRDGRNEKKHAGLDILREDVAAVMLRLLLP